MQKANSRVLRPLTLALLVILGLSTSAFGASKEILRVDTRFGPLVVVRAADDCCNGSIQYRDQKIELVSAGDIDATRQGLFQMPEGDVVVISMPSGARGMPDGYYVLLVNDTKMVDIAPKDFGTSDGTFKATQRGNEIAFDLGWENRKRKTAFYRAGVIYIGSDNAKVATSLSRQDCAYVLNTLADCRKACPKDGFMNMSVLRGFKSLEEKPVFKSDNFFKICEASCGGAAFSTNDARKQLCGY